MMRKGLAGLVLLMAAVPSLQAAERDANPDIGIGLRASTLGVGAELAVSLLDRIVLRVPFNTFRYSDNIEEDGIRYDADLDLRTVGLLLDYHAFGGGFHVSGGLYSNGNELNLLASEATGNESFQVGNTRYRSDPDEPFELSAGLDFESVAPYAGIGWGNAAQADRNGVYFKLELGILFQGSPKARATATGSACADTGTPCAATSFDVEGDSAFAVSFREELERERQDIEDSIDDYDLYPVLGLSLGYRF